MDSSSIDMGVYKTPNAFGKKRNQFYDMIKRDGKKIMSQSFDMNNQQKQSKFNRYAIQNIFGVKFKKDVKLLGPLKKHLKRIFLLLDGGKTIQQSITQLIKEKCNKHKK